MHVTEINSKTVLVVNPEECSLGGRPRSRWEGIIKMRVKIMI
jgi:hypothetical protein